MSESFTVLAERREPSLEAVAMELWELALVRGTPNEPARMSVIFRALGEDGEWDDTVSPIRLEVTGAQASGLRSLILDAVISNTPTAQGYEAATGETLIGQPVRMAGEAIARLLMAGGA
jgi:hypothetical protein